MSRRSSAARPLSLTTPRSQPAWRDLPVVTRRQINRCPEIRCELCNKPILQGERYYSGSQSRGNAHVGCARRQEGTRR